MPHREPAHLSDIQAVRQQVAAFVAAGADESVQRVITAVHRVSRRLNQWYDQQLADLDVTSGEWAVLDALARADSSGLTPSRLAAAAHVAPSSMTHRLDRMTSRSLLTRDVDPPTEPASGQKPIPAWKRTRRDPRILIIDADRDGR